MKQLPTRGFVQPFLLATTLTFIAGCSSNPAEPVAKTEKAVEAAESPVTGKTAFYEMYKLGRAWAPDMVTIYLKSGVIDGVVTTGKDGEAALWTALFVSPSKKEAREFTYRAVTQGTKRKGVSPGPVQGWGGPIPKAQPFTTAEIKLDSNEAAAKASEPAAAWLKEHPGKPVTLYLYKESRVPAPVWSVLWGAEKDGYLVIVNAVDGTIQK
ncbi:MAG: hypothetical protein ABI811_09320 [Acidobacteriota bacterium]